MALTYEPISSTTLGSDTASVTFSSISGSYTDLVLIISAKNTGGSGYNLYGRFNSDTGTNYSTTYLGGNGSSAFSGRDSSQSQMRFGFTNNSNMQPQIIHIQNYSNTTTNKTTLVRGNDSGSGTYAIVNLWRSTAAINTIYLYQELSANFVSGSTFTLYGVKASA